MPEIRQLSPSVVNKIAAGEVIERPASVVKELMENSVDAGSSRIDVSIEQGGSQLIRVADDGCGMTAEQLPLAVASHATSKLREADDLFSVRTLGFRGEALASIAEVSRFTLRSRPHDCEAGCELVVNGGAAQPIAPCGCAPGTSIEVRDLFFNTPVRQKFLRTAQTEMGHATEAFARLAIPNPQIHFTLRHNDRQIHELPPTDSWLARLAHFFGEELSENLIPVESSEGDVRLTGYVANPSQSRGNARMQYVFLNGRSIRDRALQHALGEAYRGLLMTGRYPICFLRLEMPPEMVDVNVHPTKLEVRFQDSGVLYRQLLGTLRTKFLNTDLEARYQGSDVRQEPATSSLATNQQPTSVLRQQVVDWAKGELAHRVARQEQEAWQPLDRPVPARSSGPLTMSRLDQPQATRWTPQAIEPAEDAGSEPAEPLPVDPPALQVHNRYLVTESEEGMVVIDQHALHERILYEQIREKVLAGAVESQALLVPEPVDLGPGEAAAALEHRELLEQLGVRIEPFGGDTILVSSYPAMLAKLSPSEVLRDLVERLLADGRAPERRDLLDSLLHSMSCKAAIKAGDHLTSDEIAALVEGRHLAQDAHHCPHGRPTALVFTRDELDRQFKRI